MSLMLAALATLGCSESSAPKPPELRVAALVAESPVQSSAVVGEAIGSPPAVRAVDAQGQPVKGVVVTFALTHGGGSTTDYAITTDELGVAKLARWTLGRKAGENTIIAFVGFFSVEFRALGVPGNSYRLVKLSGDFQIGSERQPIPQEPRVRVEDIYGNASAGAEVLFSVTAGGGSVTSGKAVTDSGGVAILAGWILGPPGPQVLSARTGSVTAEIFTATVLEVATVCGDTVPLVAGTEQIAALNTGGCQSGDGKFFRRYSLNVATFAQWKVESRSKEFITSVQVFGAGGGLIAAAQGDGTLDTSSFLVLLHPGAYTVVVSSATPHDVGAFTIRANESHAGAPCVPLFITAGTSISGNVPQNLCGASPPVSKVVYRVHLTAGRQITATLRDNSYSGPSLEFSNSSGVVLNRGENASPYVQTLTVTAAVTGFYDLTVTDLFREFAEYDFILQ